MSDRSRFKLPECIAANKELSSSAEQVAFALYGHVKIKGNMGICCKSYRELAGLSNLCPRTVFTVVDELVESSGIRVDKTTYYNDKAKCNFNGKLVYFCPIPEKGFLMIQRRLLKLLRNKRIKGAAFSLLLHICYRRNRGKAYPSLRKMERETGISKKTLCEAKKLLIASSLIYIQFCIKKNGAYSCNSYFLLQEADDAPVQPELTVVCLVCVVVPGRSRTASSTSILHHGHSVSPLLFLCLSISQIAGQYAMRTRHGCGVIFAMRC